MMTWISHESEGKGHEAETNLLYSGKMSKVTFRGHTMNLLRKADTKVL